VSAEAVCAIVEGTISTIGVSNRQEAEQFLYGLSPGHIVELLLNAMDDER
jgi:hypothetical protein